MKMKSQMHSTSYSPIKGLSSKEDMPSKMVHSMDKKKKKSIFSK